jgi:hypothetical protein
MLGFEFCGVIFNRKVLLIAKAFWPAKESGGLLKGVFVVFSGFFHITYYIIFV